MKTISVGFSNMWGAAAAFTPSYLYSLFPYLRPHYEFVVPPPKTDPDFMFYSVYGYIEKSGRKSTRVLLSGECGAHFAQGGKISPTETEPGFFHWGLTCAAEDEHPNHIFYPQPLLHLNLYQDGVRTLLRNGTNERDGNYDQVPPHKHNFCDFIYSNGCTKLRIDFKRKLSEYKRVECAGHVERNNTELTGKASYNQEGYLLKQWFQSRCKFSIAFENNYFPGYTTEKLSDPLVARSVPIYSGNPRVDEIFNPEAFINVDKFASYREAIEYIKLVDQDDARYLALLNAPPFRENIVPLRFTDDTYLEFFDRVFAHKL